MSNANLIRAARAKNDEFYTRLTIKNARSPEEYEKITAPLDKIEWK